MDESPKRSPFIPIKHYKEMIPLGNQIMRDIRRWTMAIDVAFLVGSTFDDPAIRNDCHGRIPKFEGVQATVLTRPFCESASTYMSLQNVAQALRRLTGCACMLWELDGGFQ